MVFVGCTFCRGVAFAFDRAGVDQDRPCGPRACAAQSLQHLPHVMAIDRPDVVEPKLFKERPPAFKTGDQFAGPARTVADRFGQPRFQPFSHSAQARQRSALRQAGEVTRHRAHGRGDAHFIVVEDHKQPPPFGACVVQRLIGHAGANRSIPDNSNRIACGLAQIAAHSEPQSRRD